MKKVVVIGLGSMGKRRVRLLRKNYPDLVIYGIDARENRQEEAHRLYSVEICRDIDEAKELGATCAFVSTSPLAHATIIKNCLERGFHVFTELNVVSDGYTENQILARRMERVLFLSSTFLYRSEIKYIKQRVAETGGKFVYFYHVGQWLPDWHPWESYKDFFVFDKRTNGVREIMVRELPWLTETFGDITDWHIEMSKISSLGLDYPDVYCMILNHHNKGVSGATEEDMHSTEGTQGLHGAQGVETTRGVVLMDVVVRKSSINLEVISENLYLTWDGTPTGVKEYNPETKEEKAVYLYDSFEHNENYAKNIVEDAYGNEIKAFFDQVEHGIEPVYNFAKDQHVLDIMDGLEAGLANYA